MYKGFLMTFLYWGKRYIRTANRVPPCKITSNRRLSSPRENTGRKRIKWALEEIGKNSVNPCIIPRMLACQMFIMDYSIH